MAGTSFTIETKGAEKIREVFRQLENPDLRPLLDAIGNEGENQTRRRINEKKTAPDGTPWAPLSDEYKRRKEKGIRKDGVRIGTSGGILELEGNLLDSIDYQVTDDDTVEWGSIAGTGSNLKYAAIHQFGGEAVGMNIPARPFLGLSVEDEADMDDIITSWAGALLP